LHAKHEIDVFEANSYVGGHTNTVDVQLGDEQHAIDMGFIVFNNWTYPNFIKLIKSIGVEYQKTEMSFSVRSDKDDLEYSGNNIRTLFAQKGNLLRPAHYKMLFEILRFNYQAPKILDTRDQTQTLGDYLKHHHYSRYFIDNYIIPMGAAIWSTDADKMFDFPARTFIGFFKNHGLLSINNRPQWYVIKGGSRTYVEKMTKPFRDHIHLNTAIEKISRDSGSVKVVTQNGDTHFYDNVFIATHSDQAIAMLEDPSAMETKVLSQIRYQYNEAVLHIDTRSLPRHHAAWAAWNYHVMNKRTDVILTYNMNILQSLKSDTVYCVTLNNTDAIAPDKILRKTDCFHPVFDQPAIDAQREWLPINGVNNTYYCGAYWGYGFHEDGVNSALRAINLFNKNQDYEKQRFRRTH
jgi:predicted NAD/FAD-binding protein